MAVNPSCVRDLLLYLEQKTCPLPPGFAPSLSEAALLVADPPFSNYALEDVYASAQYIVSKGFVEINAREPSTFHISTPQTLHIPLHHREGTGLFTCG